MTDTHNQQPDTEARILQAAEKEFLERGYDGAKTTSIAEAAGVTHAMFHYYFRTKDKLFEKIVADKMVQLGEILFGMFGNPKLQLKELIEQGVERHFDFIAANPMLPRFIFNELYLHPERLDALKNSMVMIAGTVFGNLQDVIDENSRKGNCSSVDARMLMLDIVSLNIFPFLAMPVVDALFGEELIRFLEMRKKENVKTILHKLNIE